MTYERKFVNVPVSTIHGPVIPAEVRENENISARVRSRQEDFFFNHELRVWRISPLGIELVLQPEHKIEKGVHVDLDIQIGLQKTSLTGLSVDSISSESGIRILHVRLVAERVQRDGSNERRQTKRWMCSDQFFPTAVTANPAKFNDFLYFRIRDISFGGFKLVTSLRNKFIVPGLSFDCVFNFPMVTQVNIKVLVKNVRVELEAGREVLAVGVTFDTSNEQLNDMVGNYLIQFASIDSLWEVTSSGFLVPNLSESLSYSYVKTKEEFEEVLKLRYFTYKIEDKLQPRAKYLDMSDEFDGKSRIVIGKFHGDIVCSARMTFFQVGEHLEQEKYVKWRPELPRQDDIVEIMRACTNPDYRGSDLLIGMFKYMAVAVAQAKKNWIVICATDTMVPFYEKLGFKKVENMSYEHPKINNMVHHVMIANFLDGMTGKTVGPIVWNIVWSDAVKYLSQYQVIEIDPFVQIRLTIYKWLAPIAKLLYMKKLKRKR